MSTTRSEAALIARITLLDHQVAAAEAARAAAVRVFAIAHVESQTADGVVEPEMLERSIAAQIGLACGVSATVGRRRMRMARDLHTGLVRVRELFAAGQLSEHKTTIIVEATAHLNPTQRAWVDQELARQGVEGFGVRKIEDLARSLAAQAGPEEFLARTRAARTGSRVTVRPAADGMAYLTGYLPVEQAVASYAALAAAVNEVAVSPGPVTRGRGQIMADTLVERITGQATAQDTHIEVQVLVPVEALIDPTSPLPARIPGHGPIPLELLATAESRAMWRRIVTREGIVIGGDSRQRCFTGALAALIKTRDDGRCREPFCDAPIRHVDHIIRAADDGQTEFDNGRGLCAFHNLVRETLRWRAEKVGDTIVTTTPTGTRYASGLARPHLPPIRPRAASADADPSPSPDP